MYKNQLQELAQRSCFNLPSYASVREGPDHAPRFKAAVKFNGETFESPSYCSTLRQAEHSAAEVALNALSCRGPSNSMAARILEETGVYKNLLQEVSQRVGASLPTYTTVRSGAGHLPIFTCTVELAGVVFTGEPAKNKKQAEKNAAMSAWLSLKSLVQQSESSPSERPHKDEQEHVVVARELHKYLIKARLARMSFPIKFPTVNTKPSTPQHSPATSSKILPLICPAAASRNRPVIKSNYQKAVQKTTTIPNSTSSSSSLEHHRLPPQAAGAAPYIPVSRCYPNHGVAPPVTIRNSVPVFSAPPFARPQSSVVLRAQALNTAPPQVIRAQALNSAPPVDVRQVVTAPVKVEDPRIVRPPMKLGDPFFPKMPVVRAEECKLHAVSVVPKFEAEIPHAQVESVISKVSAEDGTKSSVKGEAKELSEVEAVKDLKI